MVAVKFLIISADSLMSLCAGPKIPPRRMIVIKTTMTIIPAKSITYSMLVWALKFKPIPSF